jgi:4-hydroxybenzoate polyprenyltransferase
VLVAFVRLGRPHFLVGGFLLYGLGAAVAVTGGSAFDLRRYILGQAGITVVQLMTHYANDYFDLAADLANATPTRWSGGSRVLPSGALPAGLALWTAVVLAVLGLVLCGLLGGSGGRGGAAALWRVLLVVIYGSLPLLARGPLPTVAAAGAAVGLPIAAWQFWRLGKGAWADPRHWESLAFWSVALLVITAAGELVAFAWLAIQH